MVWRGPQGAGDKVFRDMIQKKDYAAEPRQKGIEKERIRMYGFAFEGK